MKFNFSAITLISSLLLVSSSSSSFVMAAPVDSNNTTPSVNAPATTTFDPMSGATALASISILGHDGSSNNTIRAQSVNSGSDKTFTGAATIALPIAIISALALM